MQRSHQKRYSGVSNEQSKNSGRGMLLWNGSSNGIASPSRSKATRRTQNVAALKRARDQELAVHPGQDIEYVVVDDEKSSRERVALAHEEIETYDASYYETQLVRAIESVLSPLGWDRSDIRQELSAERDAVLSSFGATDELSR